jgi:hypothetical protein
VRRTNRAGIAPHARVVCSSDFDRLALHQVNELVEIVQRDWGFDLGCVGSKGRGRLEESAALFEISQQNWGTFAQRKINGQSPWGFLDGYIGQNTLIWASM